MEIIKNTKARMMYALRGNLPDGICYVCKGKGTIQKRNWRGSEIPVKFYTYEGAGNKSIKGHS